MIESTIVDSTVQYASVDDVNSYLRGNDIDANSDPTKADVQRMLLDKSDYIDAKTRQAWRTREVSEIELDIQLTTSQQTKDFPNVYAYHRRGWRESPPSRRGLVFLPHANIERIVKLEVLGEDTVTDITTGEGRGPDKDWVCDYRDGILRPDISSIEYERGDRVHIDAMNPKVRVTYEYGQASVPPAIRDSCARLVASDLLSSDQFGMVIPSSGQGQDTPSAESIARKLKRDAEETIQQFTRKVKY